MAGDDANGGRTLDSPVVTYEWAGECEPSTAVLRTVAVATNRSETDLASLGSAVDPDALDSLIRDAREETAQISFTYEGANVSVTAGGHVSVRLAPDER